jgi:hypothetical protein
MSSLETPVSTEMVKAVAPSAELTSGANKAIAMIVR